MSKEKITLNIPTSWNDVSIGMYKKFSKLLKEKITEEEKNVKVVCILCNVKEETLTRFRYKDLKLISKDLAKLLNTEPKDEGDKLIKKVDFNNKKYGFIPNLSTISLGEYVDIEKLAQDPYGNLNKIMSILYRPIVKESGTRYSIGDYEPKEDDWGIFESFPMLAAYSALNFFFCLSKTLPKDLNKSLRVQARENWKKNLNRLRVNTDG